MATEDGQAEDDQPEEGAADATDRCAADVADTRSRAHSSHCSQMGTRKSGTSSTARKALTTWNSLCKPWACKKARRSSDSALREPASSNLGDRACTQPVMAASSIVQRTGSC